jgi:hypothetical protein
MSDSSIMLTFPVMVALRKAYDAAVAANESEFTFQGNTFVTAYAKYLLEYYEPKFGIIRSNQP